MRLETIATSRSRIDLDSLLTLQRSNRIVATRADWRESLTLLLGGDVSPKMKLVFSLLAVVAVLAVVPDTLHAAPVAIEDGGDPWYVLCAACVGFALGAGLFALPAFLAFLLTPAGELAIAGCGVACLGAAT